MATVSKAFFVLNMARLSVTDCFFFVELFRELDGVFSADEPFAGPKILALFVCLLVLACMVGAFFARSCAL